MSSKLAVVLCLVLASLELGVHAHHNSPQNSPLVQHTHDAQHTINALPSHCSAGTTELILAEETRVSALLESCSKRAIFFQISELLTDTSYFGFSLYNNGKTLFSDVKTCLKEKCMMEKFVCFLEKSPSIAKSAVELVVGSVSYALQMKDYLPKIESEIKECRNSTVTEYQQFLDGVVGRAVMC